MHTKPVHFTVSVEETVNPWARYETFTRVLTLRDTGDSQLGATGHVHRSVHVPLEYKLIILHSGMGMEMRPRYL